jgi:hypothetical protein
MNKESKDALRASTRYLLVAVLVAVATTISSFVVLSQFLGLSDETTEPLDPTVRDGVYSTSLVRIIANPEIYAGKRVLFIAYLKTGFEEKGLYISADDANLLNTKQALWLGGLSEGVDWSKVSGNGYVMVVGTLQYAPDKTGYGHMGLWLAELTNIEEILPRHEMYERRLNESKFQNQSAQVNP